LLIAFCLAAVFWIDIGFDGRLYPSLLAGDTVKHAATVRALVEGNAAPPLDPFFLRAAPAGYYYFFYTPSAVIELFGFGLIDSRAAVGGQLIWTALAVLALAVLLIERSGWLGTRACAEPPRQPFAVGCDDVKGQRAPIGLVLAVVACGGLQMLIALPLILGLGFKWGAQFDWFTDQMTSWPLSALWVPHHVAALVASWAGLLALIEARDAARGRRIGLVVLAGLAFASAAGLSTWVTIGTVVSAAIWAGWLAARREWRLFGLLAAAGAVALCLAAPHLADVAHNRSYGDFPVAFRVRSLIFAELVSDALGGQHSWFFRLVALPLTYFLLGGLAFVGSLLFWRRRGFRFGHPSETARAITATAIGGLFVGSFFASTISLNDLGWRVVLLFQLAAVVWTTVLLAPVWERVARGGFAFARLGLVPREVLALFVLGYLGVAHELVGVRAYQALGMWTDQGVTDARVDHDLRLAYEALARDVPATAVVQHNPDRVRAFAYGLYGRQRTAVADEHNGILFGAGKTDVARRIAALKPVFVEAMTARRARAVLAGETIDVVVVSALDPVWQAKGSWVFASPAVVSTPRVRVLRVDQLVDAPAQSAAKS
jgi:hypothetical protein